MTSPAPTSSPEARTPMALHKSLTKGVAAVVLLTTLSACGSDSDTGSGGSSASPSGRGAGSDAAKLPSAKTLRDVQKFISGAGLPCDNLTDDESAKGTPAEGFLGPSDENDSAAEKAEIDAWAIRKSGFCGETRSDLGGWIIYLPSDMKAFQENYRKQATKEDGWKRTLARGEFMVGADFVLDPTNYQASKSLLEAGLLLLNCDPAFKAPDGYRIQDAQADGCVLTNYLLDPLDQ
ncbi:hypothetical protein [Streptomyces sp. LUP30]|uniref:hypothetical protein n=1 Tax=Streptomyces sp. LUP30 TaxID=1890285 RepID=UPI0008516906|nr:hypothetical protein [Streptomyces sp. LUP30]